MIAEPIQIEQKGSPVASWNRNPIKTTNQMNGAFKRERAEDLRFLLHKNVMRSSLVSTLLIQQRQANKATECIMFLQVK